MFKYTLRQIPQLYGGRRSYLTNSQNLNTEALDKWISISPSKQLVITDSFHFERVSDLFTTIPTRDGTRRSYQPPQPSSPLGYGHHLAFFHPRTPEPLLRADGTENHFCPPEPYTRRMWAGGKMSWNSRHPLIVGGKATATSSIGSVEKKGFDKAQNPMIFVTQKIDIKMEGENESSLLEERSHVYLAEAADLSRAIREVKDIPTIADFTFKYLPTAITLFRFSALTFNAHYIHLDKEYSQKQDGYPERLVHGPLTALMLLDTAVFHNPGLQLKAFEYRARNPMIVDRAMTISGAWKDEYTAKLWCVDEDGVVGMTGAIEVEAASS